MTIKPILNWPHPALKALSAPYNWATDAQIAQDVVDTLIAHGNAQGLAAPQLGYGVRFFAYKRNNGTIAKVANPEIILEHEPKTLKGETCLSFPWLSEILILRPQAIEPTWEIAPLQIEAWALYDREARVFLHEFDHLNGITIDHHRRKARS